MTKNEARKKTRVLIKEAASHMRKKLEGALSCGAISFEDYESNYDLPRIILCALIKECEFQYRPRSFNKKREDEMKKEVTNLYTCMP